MADERNPEIVNEPKQYTAKQTFGETEHDSIGTDEARINRNESVTALHDLGNVAAVVGDDGTHYALGDDGSDYVIYRGDSPFDSLNEVGRISESIGAKRAIHLTNSGSLLVGLEGTIYKSTDGGESWAGVSTAPSSNAHLWSFTENGDGSILASEHNNPTIWESTDDGDSWTQFADGTTFSNYPNHIHRVRYHPENDYIIVTGGDTASEPGFYRSTDGGSSWDFASTEETQWVGIGVHPTDGLIYFLASDSPGVEQGTIIKVTDNGDGSPSYETVHYLNIEQKSSLAQGAFDIQTVDGDSPYYLTNSINQDTDLIWASRSTSGHAWESVGETGGTLPYQMTMSQGPYESVIDPSVSSEIISADTAVDVTNAHRAMYGGGGGGGVDFRPVSRSIEHLRPSTPILWDPEYGSDPKLMTVFSGGTGDPFQLQYNSGLVDYRNGANGDKPLRVNMVGGFGQEGFTNLAGSSGGFAGEIQNHDGSSGSEGTTVPKGPAQWDDANSQWISLVDGTTFV